MANISRRRFGQPARARPSAPQMQISQSGQPADYMSQFEAAPALPPQSQRRPVYEQPVVASRYNRGQPQPQSQQQDNFYSPETEMMEQSVVRAGSSKYGRAAKNMRQQQQPASRYGADQGKEQPQPPSASRRGAQQPQSNIGDGWSMNRSAASSSAYRQDTTTTATSNQGVALVPATNNQLQALMDKINALEEKVTEWENVWREMGDALYDIVGTVDVDGLPYYEKMPDTVKELQKPKGRLIAGEEIQLKFPQFTSCKLLFQRMITVHATSGKVESFYVPIRNLKLKDRSVEDDLGLETTKKKFLTQFRVTGVDKI